MTSLSLFGATAFSKLMTMLFTAFFGICTIGTGTDRRPPNVPEDFTPVIRFAVCSDIHLNGEKNQQEAKRFRSFFDKSYEYAEKSSTYSGLDAVMICGDMTEWGREKEYKMFSKIISEKAEKGTEVLVCTGNHEFIEEREVPGVNAFTNYEKYVSEKHDTHTVINGYHFIGLSYSDKDENYSEEKLQWLRDRLSQAVADTGDLPVFVFHHPHPTLSVYGSIHWSEPSLRKVLSDFPQAVSFSGHSHYNPSDPRSLWQGSFTAMGTGALTGLIGNINYLDGNAGTTIKSASYIIAEADERGNLRLQVFDAENDRAFPECDYYLPLVSEKENHYYTWNNLKSFDSKPLFPENAEISCELNDEGELLVSFPDAKGYYDAVSYNITVKSSSGEAVYCESVLSDYVTSEDNGVTVNIGKAEAEVYSIRVVPVSPYAKLGQVLEGEFSF